MGLAVSVGDLANFIAQVGTGPEDVTDYKVEYAKLNHFLQARGLPNHNEPESLPVLPYRGELDGFPYSWLHFLRRASAYQRKGQSLRAFKGNDATDDPLLRLEYNMREPDSHLIYHSDAEGFYVPFEFPLPLVAEKELEVAGGIVGSSQSLLRELRDVAPLIGIKLEGGNLTDETAAALADVDAQERQEFSTERMVWFTLFDAARKSTEYRTAIRFS